LTEITERWYALLYDKSVSRLALAALRNLHPQTVAAVQAKALYTKAEEQLLATISSVNSFVVFLKYDLFLINFNRFRRVSQLWRLLKNFFRTMLLFFTLQEPLKLFRLTGS